jgi:CubicO group peptidase (beta-lactamase class C family)
MLGFMADWLVTFSLGLGRLATLAVALVFGCFAPANGQTVALPRATPESQGVDSERVLEFLRGVDAKVNSMHSFMLVRHGNVVAEAWWAPETSNKPHVLWSLSKSFTSTAVGLAVSEGKLSIDDPVISFFPESLPEELSPHLKGMRVKDLLTMTTGHQAEVPLRGVQDWIKTFLAHPVPHKPGAHFCYNTPATFMQSAIVQKVTGEKVLDYLRPRLFEPLGIESPKWDESPQGISLGGYGLYLKTEDIAKFGQLYLQRGIWGDKQLIPAAWVDAATSKQVSNGSDQTRDWDQGYGFQFWRCRHDAYRGDGKDGQFCVVLPKLDAVVVMTANTSDMQGELNLVWEQLLPAFHDGVLAEDSEARSRFQNFAASLKATR